MPRRPNSSAVFLGDCVSIELSQGMHAFVDTKDYPLVENYRWCALKKGNTYYAKASRRDGSCKMVYMHQLIAPEITYADHEDGNGLNNRRRNLRQSNSTTNAFNGRKRKGSSVYHGVHRHPKGGWVASIRIGGRKLHLAYCASEDEAYKVRKEAEEKYFGEFGRTNR